MGRSQLPELFSTPRPSEKDSLSTSQATDPTSSYLSQFKYTASIWDKSQWQYTQNKPAEAGTLQIVCLQYLDNDPRVATSWPHPILPYILESLSNHRRNTCVLHFPPWKLKSPVNRNILKIKPTAKTLDCSVPLCENKDISLGLISTGKRSPASKRLLPQTYTAVPPPKVTSPSDISTGWFFY